MGWLVTNEQCEALILAMNTGNESKSYRDKRGQICLKEHIFVNHMLNGDLTKAITELKLPKMKDTKQKKHRFLSDKDSLVQWVLQKGKQTP